MRSEINAEDTFEALFYSGNDSRQRDRKARKVELKEELQSTKVSMHVNAA
jgi:hypothetical protein